MRQLLLASAAASMLVAGASGAVAQDAKGLEEIDKPASQLDEVLAEEVELPAGTHKIRVVTATVEPKTAAAWHTHPSPVYVFVEEGSLSMEVEGKEVNELTTGEATAEPLNTRMRVVNRGDETAKVVVFQVSPVDAEFLEQEAKGNDTAR
ncbi:cupin domain-containing protein [Caenispirillum salinarum]|uniref:cupin domain-containing protein n=1 Tax=Caenispirillum salinarum TaxID=859058 RepID=UPI00384A9DEC